MTVRWYQMAHLALVLGMVGFMLVAVGATWTAGSGLQGVVAVGVVVGLGVFFLWGCRRVWRLARWQMVLRRVGLVVTERIGSQSVAIVPRVAAVKPVNRYLQQVALDLPAGITYEQVQERAGALASGMGWHAVRVWRDVALPARVWLDAALSPLPVRVPLSAQPLSAQALTFLLGQSPWGPLWCDLASCPHLLIAGETGAGKSTLLHSVLASLVCFIEPEQLEARRVLVWLIDLKGGLEFARYEAAPYVVGVAGEWETALAALQTFVDELERRLGFLRAVGCASASEFWQRFPDRRAELLPGVLVIDELAQLTLAPVARPEHTKLLSLLHRATSIGRALALHVVVATQRPDADVLPGSLRANIPAVVCFRVRDETNSRLVLDDPAAALLPAVPGRGIFRYGPELTEFQGAYCDLDVGPVLAGMRELGVPRSALSSASAGPVAPPGARVAPFPEARGA